MDKDTSCNRNVSIRYNFVSHAFAAVVVGVLIGGAIWYSAKYFTDKCCPKKDCGCDKGSTTSDTTTSTTTKP